MHLMGQTEIRERLGWSRQRVYILTNRFDFPRPRWVLAMGKIWWRDDIEAWIKANRPELAEDPESEG